MPNYTSYVNQSKTSAQASASNKAIEALKAKSEIEDLRIQ
jgi:hypothetical protein